MTEAFNIATTAVTNQATYASLHTSAPNTSGSNEVSGSGYARQPVTWGSVSGGSASMSGTLDFDGPASGTVTHLGLWDAPSGGTFLDSEPLTGDQSFNAAGEYQVNAMSYQNRKPN